MRGTGCGLAAIILIAGLTGCGGGNTATQVATPSSAPPAPYSFANLKCLPGDAVKDDGKTFVFDFAPQPDGTGDDSFEHQYIVECIKMVTGLPDAVMLQMQQTSAIQGRQSATWDVDSSKVPQPQMKVAPMANGEISASWTYHPDDGLDVIMRVVS